MIRAIVTLNQSCRDKEDGVDEVAETFFLFNPPSMKVGGGFIC